MTSSGRDGLVDSLVAFGGAPTSDRVLYVGRPNVPDRDAVLGLIGEALDRRWLSNDGPMLREFEALVEERLGVRHCVAVSSATQALSIAARALGLGGEVIVPAFTFVATPHSLAWLGITPVFCDIDPVTHQLDPVSVEAAITDRTTGIIAVHTWGRPCDVSRLTDLAERHGLELLFDAAPAFGASVHGTPLGHFGRAEVFSFHATKIVNCAEGGAMVTNDDELAAAARLMRSFGFADTDLVTSLGTNAKLSELGAAMGICSLASYDHYLDVNTRTAERYASLLDGVPGISFVPVAPGTAINFHNVVIEIDASEAGIDRDLLLELLNAEQILVRRYYWPGCHRMEPYRSQEPSIEADFPVTDAVAGRVLSLPTGTAVEPADIDRVGELIAGIVEHAEEITARSRTAATERHG